MIKFMMVSIALVAAPAASAKDYTVRMLNKGAAGAMVFEPTFLKIAPGDSVTFEPTDKSHNAESIPTMLPAGAAPFKGKMNEAVTVKFDKAGIYGIKCLPHFSMGMVAMIQVGKAVASVEKTKVELAKLPALPKKRLAPLLAAVK
ncbi:pseudoazurin [Sphingobium sp. H39-3-25]|uniref:pseudoazurin n=1 Tax=Sphingobium arseniciresistens TaxID=3030834 RepID=UPI0023B8A480|nr:pseudoazurin [Sphingobium arseniciresistens]